MYRIVYVSEAVRPMGEDDLEDILGPARVANAAAGVTGLLVYAAGCFLQVIEGEQTAVEATYARTVASTRHRHVLRSRTFTDSVRQFPDWSMGFQRAAPFALAEHVLAPLVRDELIEHDQVARVLVERWQEMAVPAPRAADGEAYRHV